MATKKNNLPAESYATQGVAPTDFKQISAKRDPNTLSAREVRVGDAVMRVSLGDPGADITKKDGVETRGNGAATKGRTARGPMF